MPILCPDRVLPHFLIFHLILLFNFGLYSTKIKSPFSRYLTIKISPFSDPNEQDPIRRCDAHLTLNAAQHPMTSCQHCVPCDVAPCDRCFRCCRRARARRLLALLSPLASPSSPFPWSRRVCAPPPLTPSALSVLSLGEMGPDRWTRVLRVLRRGNRTTWVRRLRAFLAHAQTR
jgi:hypothetical protein